MIRRSSSYRRGRESAKGSCDDTEFRRQWPGYKKKGYRWYNSRHSPDPSTPRKSVPTRLVEPQDPDPRQGIPRRHPVASSAKPFTHHINKTLASELSNPPHQRPGLASLNPRGNATRGENQLPRSVVDSDQIHDPGHPHLFVACDGSSLVP